MGRYIRKILLLYLAIVIFIILLLIRLFNIHFSDKVENEFNDDMIQNEETTSVSPNGVIWRDIKTDSKLSMLDENDIGVIICSVLSGKIHEMPVTDKLIEQMKINGWYNLENVFPGYKKTDDQYLAIHEISFYNRNEFNKNIIVFPVEIERHLQYKYKYKFEYTSDGKLDGLFYIGRELDFDRRGENLYHMTPDQWLSCFSIVTLGDISKASWQDVCAVTDKFIETYSPEKSCIVIDGYNINERIYDKNETNFDKKTAVFIVSYKNKTDKSLIYKKYILTFEADENNYLDDLTIKCIGDVTEKDLKDLKMKSY